MIYEAIFLFVCTKCLGQSAVNKAYVKYKNKSFSGADAIYQCESNMFCMKGKKYYFNYFVSNFMFFVTLNFVDFQGGIIPKLS